MDVIVETQGGTPFYIKVDIFDTVLKIKEKVEKQQGIPIHRQTLVFNGQVLQDDRVFEVMLNPRIQLLVTPEHDKPQVDIEQSFPSKKIQLRIKIGSSEQTAHPFKTDVNDTVLQLKEKIHFMNSPLPANMLVAQSSGVVLQDHRRLRDYGLEDNSEILITRGNIAQSFPSKKIQLNIKIGSSEAPVPLEMDVNDTVLQLKEKLHVMEFLLPANMLVAQSSGVELQDRRHLRDYGLKDNTEIHITTRPSPSSSGTATAAAAGSERLKVTLLIYRSGAKIPVEVNASDNVGELRKELQKLQPSPAEPYFFIHKQNVVEEDQSFRWHQVSQGDTIEVFPGHLSKAPKHLV